MADDLKISLGVELNEGDFQSVQSKIDSLKNGKGNSNKITFDLNKAINSQISNLKRSLESVEKKTYTIDFQIGTGINQQLDAISNRIDDILNRAGSIPNLPTESGSGRNGSSGGRGRNGGGGGRNNNGGQRGFRVSRRKWAQKYRDAANAEEQQVIQSLLGRNGTLVSASGRQRFDKTGKETGSDWIVTYRNELGKTVRTMMTYNKEADKWRVTGTAINANYEAQAKEQDKVQNYLNQQRNAYENLRSAAFDQKGALDQNSIFGKATQDALDDYNNAIRRMENHQDEYNANNRRNLETLRSQAKIRIAEQKELQRLENETAKKDQSASDYNSKLYTKQQNALADLESKAFNQTTPLTGEFETRARDAIQQWKDGIEEINKSTGKVGVDLENRLSKLQADAARTVKEQMQAQHGGSDLVPDDISTKVSSAYSGLDIQIEKLKQAGQYTQEMKTIFDGLRESLGRVTDTNGFNEWKDSLKQVNEEIKVFQEEAKTATKAENFKLDTSNLESRLDNLKKKYEEIISADPSKASTEIEDKFRAIGDAIANISPGDLPTIRKMVQGLATDINGLQPQSLGQILSQNFGGIGQFLARFVSATYIIQKSISTIKSMVSEVTSLDSSLMELQKVTTLSGESLAQFTDSAYKTGKEVGRTGKDVIDAVTTFSRAGYDLQESNELAKSALVMTNVGVDIPNTEAAASDMISILKAYNKQANESMQVVDELYNVANKEPLDFGNITSMLVTAGGTLAQTNTSLEESMGLLTGAYATLRDNSVANG